MSALIMGPCTNPGPKKAEYAEPQTNTESPVHHSLESRPSSTTKEREKQQNETLKRSEVIEGEEKMGENKETPPKLDLDAKWDTCLDLGVRRFVYSSFACAFSGLLLFRSPVTRWASVAFGAGVGIGSAYTECSYKFDGSPARLTTTKISDTPASPPEAKVKNHRSKLKHEL
ncbi:uncharacterized protein LOC130788660 isoform X3 [Actinidia eriantha]|uniref:uncharacterized protein LOC130788660 isoform X3 n=1 Tax=Actinidia eriantha TaxID=165200 RepID=UPI00258B4ACD|nr:uncharacterized protein LOC130788660 isoform X3 [Actinidia eriantha]